MSGYRRPCRLGGSGTRANRASSPSGASPDLALAILAGLAVVASAAAFFGFRPPPTDPRKEER